LDAIRNIHGSHFGCHYNIISLEKTANSIGVAIGMASWHHILDIITGMFSFWGCKLSLDRSKVQSTVGAGSVWVEDGSGEYIANSKSPSLT
jgi:hypothetical protein